MTVRETTVRGTMIPEFEPLADVFGRLVASLPAGGAALAITLDGELVADFVAGDYPDNGLQLVFSVAKLVTSLALHRAATDGRINLDEALSTSWPELARPSTSSITLRDVLAHRSGIDGVDGPFDFDDLLAGRDISAVEVQEPRWTPGTNHGYHAFTFGTLVRGVVDRRLGCTVGDLVREYFTDPLELDLFMGNLTPSAFDRIVPVRFSPPAVVRTQSGIAGISQPGRAEESGDAILAALLADPDVFNSREFLSAPVPSMNVVTDARSLARLLAAVIGEVNGVRVVPAATLAKMTAEQSAGRDLVLGVESRFGSGVQLPSPQLPWMSPGSFGHEGAGGSAAFADEELGVSVGFTTDMFPPMAGASPIFLALLPTIRLLLSRLGR